MFGNVKCTVAKFSRNRADPLSVLVSRTATLSTLSLAPTVHADPRSLSLSHSCYPWSIFCLMPCQSCSCPGMAGLASSSGLKSPAQIFPPWRNTPLSRKLDERFKSLRAGVRWVMVCLHLPPTCVLHCARWVRYGSLGLMYENVYKPFKLKDLWSRSKKTLTFSFPMRHCKNISLKNAIL